MNPITPIVPSVPHCTFDSRRGHYIYPAIIAFAGDHGYHIDPFVQWAIDSYDDHNADDDFPR